jgi:aminoglycoside phosphotransferase
VINLGIPLIFSDIKNWKNETMRKDVVIHSDSCLPLAVLEEKEQSCYTMFRSLMIANARFIAMETNQANVNVVHDSLDN